MDASPLNGNRMGWAPIKRLTLTMAVPIMISMLAEALYNVVDGLYVSRICENALTATSLAYPIQMLIIACSVGTSVGLNAILSRSLGAKDRKSADASAMNGLFLGLCSSVLFLIFGLFFTRAYFAVQTSDTEIYEMGVQYLSVCTVFASGGIFQVMLQKILQSSGKVTESMIAQLSGAVLNVILDPILIFGWFGLAPMGVKGAAVATVISQFFSLGLALAFNLCRNKEIRLSLRGFRPSGRMIGEIYKVGVPAIAMSASGSIMMFGVNRILIMYSSTAVAAYGAYYKLQNFAFMPIYGLSNAVVAIAAFNYGARSRERVEQTIKWGLIYAAAILVVFMAVFQLMPARLLGLFNASDEMLALGVRAVRIITLGFVPASIVLILQALFSSLGNGVYSLITALARTLVVPLPAAALLASLFGVENVWWAFALAEYLSALVAVFLLKRIHKKKIAAL